MVFLTNHISEHEYGVDSEQSLYYSYVHEMTITVCFNFIGVTEGELDTALWQLLFPVLRNDHQVSQPNTRPDHYFGLRFMLLLLI
jgi:hypothetical protein